MTDNDESIELKNIYDRIIRSSHPHQGTRLQIAYAIARHLGLDCPAAKVIVHNANDYMDGDPNTDLGERYGIDWEYAHD